MTTGFPAALSPTVDAVHTALGTPTHRATPGGDEITVAGESITLPHRTYFPDPPDHRFRELDDLEQLVAHCLLSRHHDGRVRERQIEPLVNVGLAWVAPYVVALLGDYVIQIHVRLEPMLSDALRPIDRRRQIYLDLVGANPIWWQRIQSRVISSWNEHHRGRFPDLGEYPAQRMVAALED